MQSENVNELAKALSKFQGTIGAVKKESTNPFFKSHYADLAAVWAHVAAPLSALGLAVVQTVDLDESCSVLVTTLMHESGQWIKGSYPINSEKPGPQGFASAVSYARRYSLMSILGIAATDDDGEAATNRSHESIQRRESSQPKPVAPRVTPPAPAKPRFPSYPGGKSAPDVKGGGLKSEVGKHEGEQPPWWQDDKGAP